MNIIVTGLAALACVLHVVFCILETSYPHLILGIQSTDIVPSTRLVFFNQGFYNLFLALGGFYGIYTSTHQGKISSILVFVLLTMIGAAMILFMSKHELLRGALVQGLPPLLSLLSYLVLNHKKPEKENSHDNC